MTDKPWKATERRIAKILGGTRVPITGRQRGDAPDIDHPVFSIEVKHREKLPGWMLEAIEQAVMSAKANQLPIVVLHQKGQRDDVVMIRLSDFAEWYA